MRIKKFAVALLCLGMLLCSGCLDQIAQIEEMRHTKETEEKTKLSLDFWGGEKETTAPVVQTVPETTVPVTTAPPVEETVPVTVETIPIVTLPVETVPVVTENWGSTNYKQRIEKGQEIYSGPGFSYAYVGSVEASTNYTIVDEAYDSIGHLWGKLKSGVGWVDLTDIHANSGGGYTGSTSYVVKIRDGNCPIYSGPGYDYSYVGTVKKAGSYTIVQESYDIFGNLWGKLKSGIGWVCLSDYS